MQLNSQVKFSLLTALFTVILFFILNAFFSYFNVPFITPSSTNSKATPFTVQGTGSATAQPDKAQISFSVTKTATTLKDAQNQANTSTNTIVSDVEKLGVTKNNIQTSNYNSSPNYDNNNNVGFQPILRPNISNQTILSYTVSENITVSIMDNNKVNAVIDTVTKDNAENISGPNYVFSDSSQQSLQDKARTQAINNAKQKAESIATAAGIRLGRVISVQENNGIYPVDPIMMKSNAAVSGSAPTQINPGENTVTANVTLSYQTY